MVSGFDILGHNRTLQVHWLKRVVAFLLDLITVFAPLWSVLFLEGIRAPWVYGVSGGILLYAYSTFSEAISRTTVGKFIVGLEGGGPSPRRKPIVVRRPCFRATVMIEPTLIRDE